MKKLITLKICLIAFMCGFLFTNCDDKDNNNNPIIPGDLQLEVSKHKIEFIYEKSSEVVELQSNYKWLAIKSKDASWVTVSPDHGEGSADAVNVTITAAANEDTQNGREAIIRFVQETGNLVDSVVVTQGPKVANPGLYKDEQALRALYKATRGYEWAYQWDLDQAMDTWYGVTIEPVDGVMRVTGLVLDHGGLKGQLPEQLGDLSELKKLAIRNSSLNQTLPEWLPQSFPKLTFLAFPACGLYGQIPESYYDMTQLTRFDLDLNPGLSGTISDKIGNLVNLETWQWSGSFDRIPETVSNMRSLIGIQLESVKFTDGRIPENIGNCSELKDLILENCNLQGSIPASIGNLKKLRNLWLDANNLTGGIPAEISGCVKLEDIRLSFNPNLGGSLPAGLSQLDSLWNIQASKCGFTGQLPDLSRIAGKAFLHLIVDKNNLGGTLPEYLSKLTTVELDSNNFTGAIPDVLFKADAIETLKLGYNNFDPIIVPMELWQCMSLRSISLAGMKQISGSFPADGTIVNGAVTDMSMMSGLRDLDLTGCNFTGGLPSKLFTGNIANLKLADNNFTGSLPNTLASANQLVTFTVNNNQLTGEVTAAMKNHVNWTMWRPAQNICPQQGGSLTGCE